MTNILLVDDEDLIRERLMKVFPVEKHGFAFVGQAVNGQEALALCDTLPIDIIVSDIVMPQMDGIALAERVRQDFPHIKMIFLTSHDDFQYAREALRASVQEYLLKNDLDFPTFLAALERAKPTAKPKEKPDRWVELTQRWQLLTGQTRNFPPQMETDFLEEEELSFPCCCQVTLIKLAGFSHLCEQFSSATMDSKKFLILDCAPPPPGAHTLCKPFLSPQEYLGAMLFFPQTLLPHAPHILEGWLQSWVASIQQKLGILCVAGYSQQQEVWEPADIRDMGENQYKQAHQALLQWFYRPEQGIFPPCQGSAPFLPLTETVSAQLQGALRTVLEKGELSQAEQSLRQFIAQVTQSNVNPLQVKQLVFQFHQQENQDSEDYEQQLNQGLKFLETIQDLQEFIYQYLVAERFNLLMGLGSKNQYVRQVMAYLQNHYADAITLEHLGKEFHLSPNYLSHIFKKETKMSIVSYINKLRIQQATHLLESTNCSLQEVSQQVGIKDYKYFLKVFKQYTGKTPNEVKKKMFP